MIRPLLKLANTVILPLGLCHLALSIAIAQDLSKPSTPSIELLQELPEVAAVKPVDESAKTPTITTEPKIVAAAKLRPQSDTLSGSDPKPNASRPGYLETVQGMDSEVQITGISPNADFGAHSYSKRQVWNADETKLDIGRKILDAKNNYKVLETHPLSGERIWSTKNPNLIYGLARNPAKLNNFATYNISTQKLTFLREFANYEKCTIGEYEGSLSIDDRYVLLSCVTSSGTNDLISYDIKDNQVLGTARAASDFNWGSYSQSGQYVIVENNAPGQNIKRELIRYDRNMENRTVISEQTNHGDLGVDENGDDVYVMIAWDKISYVRLKDGKRVSLSITDRAGDGHVSCRAYKRPGWCYFSSKDQFQRLAAVKISEHDSVVEVWGFSKATSSSYLTQPKVSVSPSGTKLVYTSDWSNNLNQNTPHPGNSREPREFLLELKN